MEIVLETSHHSVKLRNSLKRRFMEVNIITLKVCLRKLGLREHFS